MKRSALGQGQLQGIQDEAGMGGTADPPADEAPGEDVDDEGDVHKSRLGSVEIQD
jgi:hypothetical protein